MALVAEQGRHGNPDNPFGLPDRDRRLDPIAMPDRRPGPGRVDGIDDHIDPLLLNAQGRDLEKAVGFDLPDAAWCACSSAPGAPPEPEAVGPPLRAEPVVNLVDVDVEMAPADEAVPETATESEVPGTIRPPEDAPPSAPETSDIPATASSAGAPSSATARPTERPKPYAFPAQGSTPLPPSMDTGCVSLKSK